MHHAVRLTLTAALLSSSFTALAETATGTLFVQVERFQSEVPLPRSIQDEIPTGGVTWGVSGDELVLVQVDPRFVEYDYGFTTRYGYTHSVQLPAGQYRLSVVGLEPRQSYSSEKLMNRAAFVNQDVRTVTVEAGKTTALKIAPVIFDEDALKPFVPTLLAAISSPGEPLTETEKKQRPLPISLRGSTSIAWPDYHGPLKFLPGR